MNDEGTPVALQSFQTVPSRHEVGGGAGVPFGPDLGGVRR